MVQELEQREEDLQRLGARLPQQRLQRADARGRVGDGGRGEQGVVEPGGKDGLREAGEPEAEGAGDLSFFFSTSEGEEQHQRVSRTASPSFSLSTQSQRSAYRYRVLREAERGLALVPRAAEELDLLEMRKERESELRGKRGFEQRSLSV